MRHLRKLSIPNGESEIAKQTSQQFPADWEIEKAKREKRAKEALQTVFTAIQKANKDVILVSTAIKTFKDYLKNENDPKSIIKTGKHFSKRLLVEALKLSDSCKAKLDWKVVLNSIRHYAPANRERLLNEPEFLCENASKSASLVRTSLQYHDGNRLNSSPQPK